jgi:FkbM family methyltransferase
MFRSYVSKWSSSTPRLFYLLKKIDLLVHYVLKIQHEPEFAGMTNFISPDSTPLIVDIGANIGQSGLDFANLYPSARIMSFEPNRNLAVFLNQCRRLIGDRYQFKMVGMSDRPGSFDLFVPKRGGVFIFGEASTDRDVFEDADVRRRLGNFSLATCECEFVNFDSTGLNPDIVKIDVQGHELKVLMGMRDTLKACRPYFFIERSPADEAVMQFLEPYKYQFFLSDGRNPPVPYANESDCVNMLCAPTGGSKAASSG